MNRRGMASVFNDAVGHLRRAKTRHAVSLAVLILSFLMSGLFLSLSNNLRARARALSKDVAVVVYFSPSASDEQQRLTADRVRRSSLVASIRFISPQDASDAFLKEFPDLKDVVENLGRNPLPASIEATLRNPAAPETSVAGLVNELRGIPGVEDVQFNRHWSDRIRALGRLSDAIGFLFGGLLILISITVVSGAIRLNILNRRLEIDILHLVGASNSYIRGPFLVEGLILGAVGGGAAAGLVSLAARIFTLYLGRSLGAFQDLLGFEPLSILQTIGLIAGGGLAGLLGSLAALGKVFRS